MEMNNWSLDGTIAPSWFQKWQAEVTLELSAVELTESLYYCNYKNLIAKHFLEDDDYTGQPAETVSIS